jgi:hypothetical protein
MTILQFLAQLRELGTNLELHAHKSQLCLFLISSETKELARVPGEKLLQDIVGSTQALHALQHATAYEVLGERVQQLLATAALSYE